MEACYIKEKRIKEFFDYYTKLEYVSMKTKFSQPPSCHPSIVYNITVIWEKREYNVYFEMVDDDREHAWFYSFKTDLEACGHFTGDCQLSIGNQYFGHMGYLSERTIKMFMLGDETGIDTIKQIKARPQIEKLEKDIEEINDALVIINKYKDRDLHYERTMLQKELKELEAIK